MDFAEEKIGRRTLSSRRRKT